MTRKLKSTELPSSAHPEGNNADTGIRASDRLRVKEAAQKAGVSSGMIYVWMHEERFKTWTVVRRGFERGVRYIDRASFENFLESRLLEYAAQREEDPSKPGGATFRFKRCRAAHVGISSRCDGLRARGIVVRDFNFGGATKDQAYKNEGARVWHQVAKLVRDGRIVTPDRYQETIKMLFAQLASRRQKTDSSGKLGLESKDEMRARGVKSPDIADAFVMAFGVEPVAGYSYLPFDDSGRAEIARAHKWMYSGAEPGSTQWGYTEHPSRDELTGDDGRGNSTAGFAGISFW